MLEYQTFCYLQNQKTGCTFVESFLREFSSEKLVSYNKHAPVPRRDPAKFYFVNVREPGTLYRSLFAYGLDGRGTVYQRLKALGHQRLYAGGPEGFAEWLRFVFDPANAAALDKAYTPGLAQVVGFMSWRFLRLACAGFEGAAPAFTSRKELNEFMRTRFFMNAVLKQESLREDLGRLVQGPLAARMSNQQAALAWLEASPKINTSVSITDSDEVPIDNATREQLLGKERVLYRSFYPEAPGFAEWKAKKDQNQ